jgi:hypothetical protein
MNEENKKVNIITLKNDILFDLIQMSKREDADMEDLLLISFSRGFRHGIDDERDEIVGMIKKRS